MSPLCSLRTASPVRENPPWLTGLPSALAFCSRDETYNNATATVMSLAAACLVWHVKAMAHALLAPVPQMLLFKTMTSQARYVILVIPRITDESVILDRQTWVNLLITILSNSAWSGLFLLECQLHILGSNMKLFQACSPCGALESVYLKASEFAGRIENTLWFTQVNEAAGSYLWRDASGSNRADGLQGALIVHAKGPEPWQYDEERTLFVTDWFHGQSCCCCCCCCCNVWLQSEYLVYKETHSPTLRRGQHSIAGITFESFESSSVTNVLLKFPL